jgi:CCR4-NOT transcription complex subunit 2
MFGGSSSGQQNSANGISELLLGGAGGFASAGSSLGNGFGNAADTSSSRAATMAPGGTASGTTTSSGNSNSSKTTFDLNDFPSLGGSVVMQGSNSDNNSNSNNGLAAALRDQQRLLAHHNQQLLQQQGSNLQQQEASSQQQKQQQQNNLYRLAMQGGGSNGSNFNMATEDFPALPGAPPSNSTNVPVGAGGNGDVATSGSSSLLMGGGNGGVINSSHGGSGLGGVGSAPSRLAVAGGIYGGNDQDPSSDVLGGGGPGLGVVNLSQQHQQQSQSNSQRTKSDATPAGTALNGDYGLLGLLGVIRMTDADRNALALGSDLTMLGLNLGSNEHIYNTFSGPWSESSGNTKEPHYQLPACYYMQPPALKTGHLQQFQPETLFYIFYALPKDVLQAYAAQELYTREWRYHGDLKLWFKRAGPADGIPAQSSAGQQYLYFDINSWEKRLFNGSMNQNVTGGFLTEEDVRVRFPST